MKRMKKGAAIAWLIILAAVLGGIGYYSFGVIKDTVKKGDDSLKLGLDLNGGVSITYEVQGKAPSADEMNDTIFKLQQRIENDLGEEAQTTEASVYQVGDRRIAVEIPGVSDANALLEELGTPGTLYFIKQTNADGQENYSYSGETGNYELNYDIEELIANESVVLTGTDVKSAEATYQTNQTTQAQSPVVSITLNDSGTKAFGAATLEAYSRGESIGIYYDGRFVSVPKVNAAITNGQCIIEGMGDYEEAKNLASYIRIGGLSVELKELQSEVVGASLGSNALATSLKAAGIGLVLVMIFLIIMYLVPGAAASIALAIYTALMIAILKVFDITLTLPGIAGMILSIGMAVDANVIIFARIREEIAAGRSVASSIDAGFKKAMSAILDGNITTLIAAAVLGLIGSGTVKGFAITLAIGVLLSMFTALVVTRIILNAFYGVGIRSEKVYGKAKEATKIDFIGKRKIGFIASSAVIIAGLVAMIAFGGKTGKALNYSLEFMGGTSTTVELDKDYTIDELDEVLKPIVSDITGDNDIQIQKVNDGNQVVIKTKTLSVEKREALDNALEENFSVDTKSISSQNISSSISGEMRRTSVIAVIVAAVFMLLYIWFRFKDIRFAGSAIIALIHDVLVVLTLYAIARLSVGNTFIACMLTVIGYSVNDTIVVFDRIRENAKSLVKKDADSLAAVANASLNQTLSRSLSTSITTAIMVLMLLILGVASIREFALPLLAGVIVGTYSSIFIATQLWYVFRVKVQKKAQNKK